MPETGFLDRTITIANARYRYQVYVPATYAPLRSWPVILFLHGAGESGVDGLRPTDVGIGSAIRRRAERFPTIVVFPQARPECDGWRAAPAAAPMRGPARPTAEFRADPGGLYLPD